MTILLRIFLITIIGCCYSVSLNAQIQPISTHYMFNTTINNPAFYGSKDGINLGANNRYQWAKLDGQPRTLNAFADAAIPAIHGGVGFSIYNDRVGAYNITSVNAGYAYIQSIKNKIKISIGINAGVTISKLDGSKLITPQGNDNSLNDDFLSSQLQRSLRPNLGFGIAVTHKFFEAGISYNNLIQAKDKFKGDVNTLKTVYGGVFQTYAAGKIKVGKKKNVNLKPALAITTDFKKIQTDISFMTGYKDYFAVGINARGYNKFSFESLSPIISVGPLKNICVIYSYDVSLTRLNNVNKGTHEVTLNYILPNNKIYKRPKIINNPRFL